MFARSSVRRSARELVRFLCLSLCTVALAAAPAQGDHKSGDGSGSDGSGSGDGSDPDGSDSGSDSGDGSGGSGDGSDTGSPPSNRLSESETAYTGAIMLEGGKDVQIGPVVPGSIGTPNIVDRNARFIGNTLYAEGQDAAGNAVAMVIEFYWFESSVPRGSDFFVGVVKGRTIPNLAERWVLEHEVLDTATDRFRPNRGATLYVRAETNPDLNYGGFRWDWSLPFRDYSMDAYGTIRMNASYGVGVDGNGVAQSAYQINEHGVKVKVDGQVSGHLNNEYRVNTNYEITLYRWDVYTRNSAAELEWSLFLRTSDRERRNAYHEYFIAMQTPRDEEFRINRLEVGGHVKHQNEWWIDEHRALSVAVEDIVISRPDAADRVGESSEEQTHAPADTSAPDAGTGDYEWSSDGDAGFGATTGSGGGCAVEARGAGRDDDETGCVLLGSVAALALLRLGRRRRSP